MIQSIESAIGTYVDSDTRKPYTSEAHDTAVEALKAFIPARAASVNP
jgi:hypothetical protein